MGEYSVQHLPEEGIIRVRLIGDFDAETLSMSTKKLAEEISRSHCNRILMDHREATPKLSTLDLYDRPNVAESLGIPKKSRIEIIYSKDKNDYQFIENVGLNQGFRVKIFKNYDDGMKWLKT